MRRSRTTPWHFPSRRRQRIVVAVVSGRRWSRALLSPMYGCCPTESPHSDTRHEAGGYPIDGSGKPGRRGISAAGGGVTCTDTLNRDLRHTVSGGVRVCLCDLRSVGYPPVSAV